MKWYLAMPCLFGAVVVAQPSTTPPAATTPPTADHAAASRLAAQGDHLRAIDFYQQILGGDDSLAAPVQVRRGLAMSLLMAGKTAEASRVVMDAMERFPEDAGLQRVAAGVFSSQGQYAQAIEHLESAAVLEPYHATDHANLGGLYTKLGRFAEAERALQRAGRLAPKDAVVHRRLGGLYLQARRYGDSIEQLELAASLEPASPTTAYLLGQAREGVAEPEPALASYERAWQLDPSYMDAHYRTAQLSRRLGQSARADSAMAAYTRLRNVGGGDADALKQMGFLRDAIVESGDQPDHIFALAKFLFDHGYLDESQNRLEVVLRQRPDNYRAHNQLGNIHLRRRNPALALVEYETAVGISPDFEPALLNAGNACMLLKEPGRAIQFYTRVVALAPEVAMAWYGLGSAHLELDRREIASRILQQGMERTHPEGKTKAAFLQQLRKARLTCPPGMFPFSELGFGTQQGG